MSTIQPMKNPGARSVPERRCGRTWLGLGGVLLLLLAACNGFQSPARQRARLARHATGDILIGAAGAWRGGGQLARKGIETAAEEINGDGGIMGRKLQILFKDDDNSVHRGKIVAQEFAENPQVVAVIGHFASAVSLAVSTLYQFNGVLMLSPMSTVPELTQRGFDLVFRCIPSDAEFARQLVDYARQKGLRKALIYHVRTIYGKGFADAVEKNAALTGLNVVDRRSFSVSDQDVLFRRDLADWKEYYDFDSIFLAGGVADAAKFLRLARSAGVSAAMLGGDLLNDPAFLRAAGAAAEGMVIITAYHPGDPDPLSKRFADRFFRKYGVLPDEMAAQGYDAVKLLAGAMEKARSTVPEEVAQALRTMKDWRGVTGITRFDRHGDVVGKGGDLVEVRGGRFRFLQAAVSGSGG